MKDDFLIALVGAIIGFFIGSICILGFTETYWRADAIKHNAAHYDTMTGEWHWNDKGAQP